MATLSRSGVPSADAFSDSSTRHRSDRDESQRISDNNPSSVEASTLSEPKEDKPLFTAPLRLGLSELTGSDSSKSLSAFRESSKGVVPAPETTSRGRSDEPLLRSVTLMKH
jgi:hypothetical protein